MKPKKSREKTCWDCEHCLPIGEGDHICDECGPPEIIIDEYIPTDAFYWCHGGRYVDR